MTEFLLFLQRFSSPLADMFFLAVSALTSEVVFFLVLGYIYWCLDKEQGYLLGLSMLLSFTVNSGLKNLFQIPRPYTYSLVRQIDMATGYGHSFPSAHAQLSTTFAVLLGKTVRKKWAWIAGIVLVALTGISRMYLGVHTPLDIAAGILLGVGMGLLGCLMVRHPEKRNLFSAVCLALTLLLLFFVRDKDLIKMAGFFSGFVAGHLLETNLIRSQLPEKNSLRLRKLAAGIFLVLAVKLAFSLLGLPSWAQYLSAGLMVTAGVPFLSKLITNRLQIG